MIIYTEYPIDVNIYRLMTVNYLKRVNKENINDDEVKQLIIVENKNLRNDTSLKKSIL